MTDTAGYPRWTADVTWSAGNWLPAYPVSNLSGQGSRPAFARVARSVTAAAADTKFRGVFSQPRLVQMVVLCHHNFSINAQWRVRLFYANGDTNPIYDSGLLDAYPVVYGAEEVTWDGGNFWDRKASAAERAGQPQDARLYIPGNLTAAAFRVDVVDRFNPAGFVQIGLCEVSAALDFPIGFLLGCQLGMTPRSVVTEADGGSEYIERRAAPRTFNGTLPAVARSTSLSSFYELQRLNGVDVPFYWWPSRDDVKNASRTAFMARLSQLDPITQAYFGYDTLSISVKEIL